MCARRLLKPCIASEGLKHPNLKEAGGGMVTEEMGVYDMCVTHGGGGDGDGPLPYMERRTGHSQSGATFPDYTP